MSDETPALLAALERGAAALRSYLQELQPLLPLAAGAVAGLPPEATKTVDAMLKRFEQLADGVRSVARTVVALAGEPYGDLPMRQILDRLERLGALASADELMRLVRLRHRFTHVYPTESAEQAAMINAVASGSATLIDETARLARFARERDLLLPSA